MSKTQVGMTALVIVVVMAAIGLIVFTGLSGEKQEENKAEQQSVETPVAAEEEKTTGFTYESITNPEMLSSLEPGMIKDFLLQMDGLGFDHHLYSNNATITICSEPAEEEGLLGFYAKFSDTTLYYVATIRGDYMSVVPLRSHVEGINDDAYEEMETVPTFDGVVENRSTNSEKYYQTDTTGNIPMWSTEKLTFLPSMAAQALPDSFTTWLAGQGYTTEAELCSINPDWIVSDGAKTSFNITSRDTNMSTWIVNCVYDSDDNSFTFTFVGE